MNLCRENPICPPEAIVKHPLWLTDEELRFKTLADREIKSAISNCTNQLTSWSMADYQKLYNDPKCNPIFSAGYGGNFETSNCGFRWSCVSKYFANPIRYPGCSWLSGRYDVKIRLRIAGNCIFVVSSVSSVSSSDR